MNPESNLTPQQRQLAFEATCKLRAVSKFRKDNHKLSKELKGGYASGTSAGRALSQSLTQYLTPYVENNLDRIAKAKHTTVDKANALMVCKLLGTEKVVGITVKTLIDTLGLHESIIATKLLQKIGNRLIAEYVRTKWDQALPEELKRLETKYKNAGIWHKLTAINFIMGNYYELDKGYYEAMIGGVKTMVHAGAMVLEPIIKQTDWIEKDIRNVKKRKQQTFFNTTSSFDLWFRQYHEEMEHELQQAFPMLCPPREWDEQGMNGGYLEPTGRYEALLKDRKGKGSTLSPKQLEFVNKALQPTAWEINPFIHEVQNALFRMPGGSIDSFRPIQYHPLTNEGMPDHIEALATDHPARVEWRKEKALINQANAESRRKGVRTVRNMVASRELKDETIYVPWSIGHNGRCYPMSQGALSPQGTDAEKSILRFHDPAPITDDGKRWLALHLANCFGVSQSHQLKLDWCEENADLITAIALDPLGNIHEWEHADEPFQFIAACDEYYHCVIKGDRLTTQLPISVDATASGLQILALLGRDEDCAREVNLLTTTSEKMDIYARLKVVTQELLLEKGRKDLVELYIPRKCYKSSLVSRIYGSVLRSRATAIRKHLLEAHNYQFDIIKKGDITLLAQVIEEAMHIVAPNALKLFDQLKAVGVAKAKLNMPSTWTTPLGNLVVVAPSQTPTKRVDLGWMGRLRLPDPEKADELLVKKVRSSTAPLFIHSLDACCLVEAFHNWRKPITTTHDCFSVRATDMSEALQCVLTSYVTILKDGKKILKELGEANNVELSIKQGSLSDQQVESIINCQYAFC